jgi:hypothetical protein
MACSRYEPMIALYVEGDLSTAEIEEHLRLCPGCRRFADELRDTQRLLRGLREEEAPVEALAEVRNRVLEQVASRRPSWLFAFRWWHGLGAGATAAVLGGMLFPRPAAPPSPRLPPFHPPAPALSGAGPRPAATSQVARTKAGRAQGAPPAAARGAAPREPLLVKMFTDDPDVVIYWLIDQNGGSL